MTALNRLTLNLLLLPRLLQLLMTMHRTTAVPEDELTTLKISAEVTVSEDGEELVKVETLTEITEPEETETADGQETENIRTICGT